MSAVIKQLKKTGVNRNVSFLAFGIVLLALSLVTQQIIATSIKRSQSKIRTQLDSEAAIGNTRLMNEFVKEAFNSTREFIADGQSPSKSELLEFINELENKGFVIRSDLDATCRPLFVGAQGEFERMMAEKFEKGEILHLVGMIHTPTPATPLCTEGNISAQLVDPILSEDRKRLYTVMSRASIVREYLDKGAILFAVYPKEGMLKRSAEQQAIFQDMVAQYPQNLLDIPLSNTILGSEMVGATYLFKTRDGSNGAFAIMASQANAPDDDRCWGIWFGSLEHPMVRKRVSHVLDTIHNLGGPNMADYLLESKY